MASDVVIRAEGLGKKYMIGHQAERERYTALRDVIARNARTFGRTAMDLVRGRPNVAGDEVEAFWALKDVDFEIRRGEVVGVIGRNGAGKSTLLKILSRITEPTEGRVEIKGRVASLLEVGTGFHPELTGRENIYLNGAILGMTRAEIRRKFDEIVAFAEVERFLDTPVKRYSSGMYVRLAFAVAAHLEPEILVVDEVLAVGDAEFQKKCLGKMGEVAGAGRTVLFVSHNMAALQGLCPTSLWLSKGELKFYADSVSLIQQYMNASTTDINRTAGAKIDKTLTITGIIPSSREIIRGQDLHVDMIFDAMSDGIINQLALLIYSSSGIRVGIVDLREHSRIPSSYTKSTFVISVNLQSISLIEGTYHFGIWAETGLTSINILHISHFTMTHPTYNNGFLPYPNEYRGTVHISHTLTSS